LGSYWPGAVVSGFNPWNSFLATVFVEENLGAAFKILILSLWYSSGPGVFSFSYNDFLGDFVNAFEDAALYLVPVKAGSCTPGPGYDCLNA
jgi:hypothetical protein